MITMYAGRLSKMQNIKHLIISTIAATLLPLAVSAEIVTVETVGQAVATGALADNNLKKRALQDALYLAALKGGADVNGYSALTNSSLTSDVLVIRPNAHILDYSVISSKVTNKKAQVTIRAVVGSLDSPGICARRASLDIALQVPQIIASPSAPAWLNNLQNTGAAALKRGIGAIEGVTVSYSAVHGDKLNSNVDAQFDYASLTLGIADNSDTRPGTKTLTTQISLSSPNQGANPETLQVKILTVLLDPSLQSPSLKRQTSQTILLRKRTLFASINANSIASREDVIGQIDAMAVEAAQYLIAKRACQAMSAPLILDSGNLTAPFGRKDGLTQNHLAYTQGDDTPYEILEIEALKENSVHLRPLDSNRTKASFEGQTIEFMELK